MLRRNLPLSPEQRAEFGEYAESYTVEAKTLTLHWIAKNAQANRLIDEAIKPATKPVKLHDDAGNKFYIETGIPLSPGENLTVADDQDEYDCGQTYSGPCEQCKK